MGTRRPTRADRSRPHRAARQLGRFAAARGRNTRDRAAARPAPPAGRTRGSRAGRPAAAPEELAARHVGPLTLRMPNAMVAASTDASATGSASHRHGQIEPRLRSAAPSPWRGRATSIAPRSPRRPRAARRVATRAAPIATSAVPVQTSSSVSRPGELQRRDRPAPPIAIEAGRQHRVEQVVARRDRVEHARNLRGDLSTIVSARWPQRRIQCANPVVTKYRMPTQPLRSKGALHLRQVVGRHERLLVDQQRRHERDAREVDRTERRRGRRAQPCTRPWRCASRARSETTARRRSAPGSIETVRAIEVHVLAGIENVEAADPQADRQPEQPRLRRADRPPAASQPPTGATAIARPRNACV